DGTVHCTELYLTDYRRAVRDSFVCPRFLTQVASRSGSTGRRLSIGQLPAVRGYDFDTGIIREEQEHIPDLIQTPVGLERDVPPEKTAVRLHFRERRHVFAVHLDRARAQAAQFLEQQRGIGAREEQICIRPEQDSPCARRAFFRYRDRA